MRLIAGAAVIALLSACTSDATVTPAPAATSTQAIPPVTASPLPDVTYHPTGAPATPTQSPPFDDPTVSPDYFTYDYLEFDVPIGSHPHDVAPHPDGSVWYTAQNVGKMGRLDPATTEITEVTLPALARRRTV